MTAIRGDGAIIINCSKEQVQIKKERRLNVSSYQLPQHEVGECGDSESNATPLRLNIYPNKASSTTLFLYIKTLN